MNLNTPTWFSITGDGLIDGGIIGGCAGCLALVAMHIVSGWIKEAIG